MPRMGARTTCPIWLNQFQSVTWQPRILRRSLPTKRSSAANQLRQGQSVAFRHEATHIPLHLFPTANLVADQLLQGQSVEVRHKGRKYSSPSSSAPDRKMRSRSAATISERGIVTRGDTSYASPSPSTGKRKQQTGSDLKKEQTVASPREQLRTMAAFSDAATLDNSVIQPPSVSNGSEKHEHSTPVEAKINEARKTTTFKDLTVVAQAREGSVHAHPTSRKSNRPNLPLQSHAKPTMRFKENLRLAPHHTAADISYPHANSYRKQKVHSTTFECNSDRECAAPVSFDSLEAPVAQRDQLIWGMSSLKALAFSTVVAPSTPQSFSSLT
jgi:hypothetical protein